MIVTIDGDPVTSEDVITFETSPITVRVTNNLSAPMVFSVPKVYSGFKIDYQPDRVLEENEFAEFTIVPVLDTPGEFNRRISFNGFYLNLKLSVPYTEPVYTNRARLERMFGKMNIKVWADLDGDEDDNNIEAVIYQACVDASRIIDSMLGAGLYKVPFEAPYPRLIEHIASTKVGCMLYTTRGLGIESLDKIISSKNKECENLINNILTGRVRLESAAVSTNFNAPFVVGVTNENS